MRLAGAAVVCVLAAFGAAFLVTRAVYRPAPASAGTTSRHTTSSRVKPTVKPTKTTAGDPQLPSEFAPVTAKLRPRPHHHRAVHRTHPHPAPAPTYTPPPTTTQPAPRTTPAPTYTTPAPTYTTPAPTYTTPAPTYTPPSSGSSGGSTKKHSGSGSGSGTTTIGG